MTNVLPMLVRAYDDTDARIQEEVLKRTVTLAKQLDLQVFYFTLHFILLFFIIRKAFLNLQFIE